MVSLCRDGNVLTKSCVKQKAARCGSAQQLAGDDVVSWTVGGALQNRQVLNSAV